MAVSLPNADDVNITFGTLRLAQQLPLYLPEWTLRVYLAAQPVADDSQLAGVLRSLRTLGVQLLRVSSRFSSVPSHLWPYAAIDDADVEYFLLRNVTHRLTDRESYAVADWLRHAWPVYCIRDHRTHSVRQVTDGLWGGHAPTVRSMVGTPSVKDMILDNYASSSSSSSSDNKPRRSVPPASCRSQSSFLSSCLLPLLGNQLHCHDSSPQRRWSSSFRFPPLQGYDMCYYWLPKFRHLCNKPYIGQEHDAYHRPIDD